MNSMTNFEAGLIIVQKGMNKEEGENFLDSS